MEISETERDERERGRERSEGERVERERGEEAIFRF